MATVFKNFSNNDVANTRTLLHESIPITGSIVSGTYLDGDTETNVKNFSHGMFQSVYDYPHLSSSANHIFDITMGYSNTSHLSSSTATQNAEKIQIYNQMAQLLNGHDVDGNILDFDRDGDRTTEDNGKVEKMDSVFFVNIARLLSKDEIKKGSFKLELMTGSAAGPQFDDGVFENDPGLSVPRDMNSDMILTLQDHNATTNYRVDSPAGEYGLLYSASADAGTAGKSLGHIYYQAGIAVITASVFRDNALFDTPYSELNTDVALDATYDGASPFGFVPASTLTSAHTASVEACMVSASISASAGGFRSTIYNMEFNNTTELNSTIYFCRASHNEFNYSSNPTYVTGSKIRVKESSLDQPVSYVTTIGLYSADNELLAVAKLSEPIKKTPETELTFRVRLDY